MKITIVVAEASWSDGVSRIHGAMDQIRDRLKRTVFCLSSPDARDCFILMDTTYESLIGELAAAREILKMAFEQRAG